MSDYTIEMFQSDHDQLIPILQAVEKIKIPGYEWPEVKIEEATYKLNPNLSIVDIFGFFVNKYGMDKGFDYNYRFTEVVRFVGKYREKLIKEGLIKNGPFQSNADNRLVRIILDSFSPAIPPEIFPRSNLLIKSSGISFTKVIKALKTHTKK